MLLVLCANFFYLPFPNPDTFIIGCGDKSSVLIHKCYCIHCSKMSENGQFLALAWTYPNLVCNFVLTEGSALKFTCHILELFRSLLCPTTNGGE